MKDKKLHKKYKVPKNKWLEVNNKQYPLTPESDIVQLRKWRKLKNESTQPE